jgi:hypothetical protein
MPFKNADRVRQKSRVSKYLSVARKLGILRRSNRLMQAELAMTVARFALDGQISAEDANAILLAYRSPEGDVNAGAASVRVQASKLRQIIKLVERDGRRGMRLLEMVVRLHESLPRQGKFSCYDVMILVARRQLGSHKALSEARVREIALSLRRGV